MATQSTNREEFIGRRFGRLVVIEYKNYKNTYVECDCGNQKRVCAGSLSRGLTTSCGCVRREMLGSRNRTHGMTGLREYSIWKNIKSRCFNKSNPRYERWGGRGITMCERWALSFTDFLADMGSCPEKFSIDRINNDGNYEPGNCRWASPQEQANNTRRNIIVEHEGRRQNVSQWARELGLKPVNVHHRIFRGVAPHKALFGRGYK